MVRFQVAFTLGEAVAPSTEMALRPQLGQPEPVAGLAQIARKDADDAWIRTAVLSSSVACADHLFETLLQSPAFLPIDGGMILLKELAFTVGSRKQRGEVERVLAPQQLPIPASKPACWLRWSEVQSAAIPNERFFRYFLARIPVQLAF
jgi:hypothetical protein